jgi:WD40 repeat protein
MFDRLNQHPAIVCIAILGSIASIVGLFYSIKTHDIGSSSDDPNPSPLKEPFAKPKLVTEVSGESGDSDSVSPIVPRIEPPWTLDQTLAGHKHIVTSIAFEKDGQRLVSGSMDGTLRVWKVGTGECLRSLSTDKVPYGTDASVYSVDVNPQGTLIASGHGRVFRLWDIETDDNIQSFEDPSKTYYSVAFSPDGKLLAAANSSGVQLLEVGTKSIRDIKGESLSSVAFDSEGSRFATAGWTGTVAIWKLDSFDAPRRAIPDLGELKSVAFSPDGKQVAVAGRGAVTVWDATTGKSVHNWSGRYTSYRPNSVAYSASGSFLASGHDDGTVRVWDSKTGEELQTLKVEVVGPGRSVHCVRFSPDGSRIAAGCGDGSIRIWTTGS